VASDLDPRAVENARANGVEAYAGDLYAPLPSVQPDLVTAVAPYVPTSELGLLHRDALAFEPLAAYDGGDDGLGLVRRIIAGAPPGATLLLELGEPQVRALGTGEPILDDEGDVRGIQIPPKGV
jgi:release factor glutamine methyltransferase